MKELTLRQLCTVCGVSRRAVQGYEKQGLIRPVGKTDRGYLLYDPQASDSVRWIRKLQDFGFSVKEIVLFQDASIPEKRVILEAKLEKLLRSQKELGSSISELKAIIRDLQ